MSKYSKLAARSASLLNGPFKHHLYIGHAFSDSEIASKISSHLQNPNEMNLKCCVRYPKDKPGASVQMLISDGVFSSVRCLIVVSKDLCQDDWYNTETQAVLDKAERFSKDMVLLLRVNGFAIPDELKGFTVIDYSENTLSENWWDKLFLEVTKDPNSAITVLPKAHTGYGSAMGYFYGFLRLVLPDFQKRFETVQEQNPEMKGRTLSKMYIIVSRSCFCPPEIKGKTELTTIEFDNKYITRNAHRAGNAARDYKSSIYNLTDVKTKEIYYFVCELATPLLTMYETYLYGLAGMTLDQLYMERDVFYYTLQQILSHPKNKECNDQFKILWWSDEDELDGEKKIPLGDFLLPILKDELRKEEEDKAASKKLDGANLAQLSLGDTESLNVSKSLKTDTTILLNAIGANPAAVYETFGIGQYDMSHRPRGKCIIINIETYEENEEVKRHGLRKRDGAKKDGDMMVKLFGSFNFEVQLHNDLDFKTIEKLLVTMQRVDHTNYDAFVCCIMTHGKQGVVFSSDGKPIKILNIVKFFNDRVCKSLTGKPKLFFIQACMTISSNDPAQSVSRLDQDGSGASSAHTLEVDASPDPMPSDANPDPMPSDMHYLEMPSPTTMSFASELKACLVPGEPDFLMSYSSLPGIVSYRDPIQGSLYIQALSRHLIRGLEIDRALKAVTEDVKQKLAGLRTRENDYKNQLPFHFGTGMSKCLYLTK